MPEKLTKVKFTNLDKILYPEIKITKAQVIEYYIKMAPKMLELLANRPAVLNRFPNGVAEEGFYEKDAPSGTPSWVKTFKHYSETAKRELSYVLCNDLDTLVWLGNLAALEIHLTLSKAESFESPDLVLFDIDPEPPLGFDHVINVVLLLKEKLDALGLHSYVKTSGKKGMHIIIPVKEGYTFQQTREFVHNIGKQLTRESEIIVSELPQSREPGTVFIDYLQNSHGRTMICPYSLRATPQATVSTPLDWNEVRKGIKPEGFNLFSVVKREKNPWEGMLKDRQRLEVS
ncbi:MAG TPA: non-homologous end-joining DNA ligase [Candidatus Krumholzibacteriaceae bacterium]|nr:non-homologous end-joining DNA ligase [Candidatus Krumholzibacteriaceae bacterium]